MPATATPTSRPHKYIASAYDSGLGKTKRYFVEATSLDHARKVLAESGLVDAEVEPYRQFRKRRRRRRLLVFVSLAAAVGVTVGLLAWRPWENISWSSSRPTRSAERTGSTSPDGSATDGADAAGDDLKLPTFEELGKKYDLDDPAVYLSPPPAENR